MTACPVCGGRGWHTAGGNDPTACGRCPAGEKWTHGVRLGGTAEEHETLAPFVSWTAPNVAPSAPEGQST